MNTCQRGSFRSQSILRYICEGVLVSTLIIGTAVIVATCVWSCTPGSLPSPVSQGMAPYEAVYYAGVTIETCDGCRGSGVAVKGLGKEKDRVFILTAGHCVPEVGEKVVVKAWGPYGPTYSGQGEVLLRFHDGNAVDFAVVVTSEPAPLFAVNLNPLCSSTLCIGETLCMSGRVDGVNLAFSLGYYRGPLKSETASEYRLYNYFCVDFCCRSGASGSGVFAVRSGRPCFTGLLVRGERTGANFLVIPAEDILKLLNPLGT